MDTSEEDTYSMMFSSLKHPIRRKILRVLINRPERFSDLEKQIGVDSSHLTYHLEGLGSLLLKTQDGMYALSPLGEVATSTMKHVEEPRVVSSYSSFPSADRRSIAKWIAFVLVASLSLSLAFGGAMTFKYAESEKTYGILDKAYNGLYLSYTQLNASYYLLSQTNAGLETTCNSLESKLANVCEQFNSLATLLNSSQSNRVFNVNSGAEYSSIQDAVNSAQYGNTILVGKGVYHEHVVVDKDLTLVGLGENETVVDGFGSDIVVTIASDNVIFEGFTVQHSGWDKIGIDIVNSNNSIVRENTVTLNGMYGVALDTCFNCSVSEKIISSTIGNTVGIQFGYGVIIRRSSSDNSLTDNIVINSN